MPPIRTYKPKKMEIWVFSDYSTIMPHSIINTSLQTESHLDDMTDRIRTSDIDDRSEEPHRLGGSSSPVKT